MLKKLRGKYKKFLDNTKILKSPDFQLEEVGSPIKFKWNKCKLETISFGHGITTTPLQAAAVYASLTNGGIIVKPTLVKKEKEIEPKRLISNKTSEELNKILRKVVTEEQGTASLANIDGYYVGKNRNFSKLSKPE